MLFYFLTLSVKLNLFSSWEMSFHIPVVLPLVHLNTWIIAPCALYLVTCEANQRKSYHKRVWWNKDCKIILWSFQSIFILLWKTAFLQYQFSSVHFSHSVMSGILGNPMDRSTLSLPVHHQLLGFTQTHVHWVDDAI